ncbi:MAG TPA: hypothetical protein VMX12_08905, partial [Acidimicrobiia bacterium]|nr:hypothetical protein [Acidimicrobiia bacterium]
GHQARWFEHGYDVLRIDHGWCTSIYIDDPNGIAIEFCCTTRAFTDDDRRAADELRRAPHPPLAEPPMPEIFEGSSTT